MQTIGERLEEARKKKGISIREAAEATKIRGDYLQKFESNHFDIGLTEIYTRGFLRTYSNFLKLPAERILNDYAALGRGEVRPRQPSREIYGRMDISVASSDEEAGNTAAPSDEKKAAPEPSHVNRGPGRRSGSSLPDGLDPAAVFKWVKIGGGVVVAILLVVFVKALFFSGAAKSGTPSTSGQASVTPTARTRTLTFIAVRPVRVTVRKQNSDGSDGEQLGTYALAAGESRNVPWPGPISIEADNTDNLDIDLGEGKRFNLGKSLPAGNPKGLLGAPPP